MAWEPTIGQKRRLYEGSNLATFVFIRTLQSRDVRFRSLSGARVKNGNYYCGGLSTVTLCRCNQVPVAEKCRITSFEAAVDEGYFWNFSLGAIVSRPSFNIIARPGSLLIS